MSHKPEPWNGYIIEQSHMWKFDLILDWKERLRTMWYIFTGRVFYFWKDDLKIILRSKKMVKTSR